MVNHRTPPRIGQWTYMTLMKTEVFSWVGGQPWRIIWLFRLHFNLHLLTLEKYTPDGFFGNTQSVKFSLGFGWFSALLVSIRLVLDQISESGVLVNHHVSPGLVIICWNKFRIRICKPIQDLVTWVENLLIWGVMLLRCYI